MGWKRVKEHYRIGHIVHVRDGDICIGSPYIPEIIRITPEGMFLKSCAGGSNDDLNRYLREMQADPDKLLQLINEPDEFTLNIPIWCYEGKGQIKERLCEQPGYPNVCHDGTLIYDGGSFSTDWPVALEYAITDATAWKKNTLDRIDELRDRLAKTIADRKEADDVLAVLCDQWAKTQA